MAEEAFDLDVIEDRTVQINRVAKVVKGGRRFRFNALVVVGNKNGMVGYGYGKAREVPLAISKGKDKAKKSIVNIPLKGDTIHYQVVGKYGSSRVFMKPAMPGTGVIAGGPVRAVLELLGVRDILTKSYGSRNPINVVKATMNGLQSLRTPEEILRMRGKQQAPLQTEKED